MIVMNYKIAVISGDGIGPEIVREARKVLDVTGKKYGFSFDYTDLLMGGDRKSTRLNSSHGDESRMPSSA